MKFGAIAISEAAGAILAHSLRQSGLSLKKGRVLTESDIDALAEAGIDSVVAACMEDGDISEDKAASRIAEALTGAGISAAEAFTGRVNLIANADGLVTFDAHAIEKVNLVDEAVTVATAPPFERASENQIVATIKIIPYAVPGKIIDKCINAAKKANADISLVTFRAKKIALAQTTLGTIKESVLAKTAEITQTRVQGLGSTLLYDERLAHTESDVAVAVKKAAKEGADIFLIAGASAITDRRDVIPAGIVEAGGEVVHCG
ncbi:MAG TPA: 4-diphosphocytidyl-2C-methyl-D-erythritol kinase, partial [Rhodospirillaceae bacterium]|nr:4-diphosphocytidyl-2C-methyl-D-erythritol kinase [Rhodospirillaceae bacterium]